MRPQPLKCHQVNHNKTMFRATLGKYETILAAILERVGKLLTDEMQIWKVAGFDLPSR